MAKDKEVAKGVYVISVGGKLNKETNEWEDETLAFPGNYTAEFHPTGAVAIIELVPDVGAENDGKPTGRLRATINQHSYDRILIV